MSKSSENPKGIIKLLDEPNIIRKKIMSAVTDSQAIVKFDPSGKPGISNLINIYSSLTNKTIKEIEKEFSNSNYGEFKKAVADITVDEITKIQTKYNEIIESDELDKILDDGIIKTRKIAEKKYKEMKHKVGLGRE